MIAQQIAVIAAIILIPVGVTLIGIGTRPRPAAAPDPVPRSAPDAPAGLTGLDDPTDPPRDVADPAPPLLVLETRRFAPLVAAGHESTAEERRDCRRRIGSELEADRAEVLRLIEVRPPELRGMLMNASAGVIAEELAVLRAYLRGALTGLDVRLRNGPAEPDDRAITACLISGLDRLPVHHGAVFHRAHRGTIALDAFFPGSVLIEPAFVRADRHAFPAGGIGTGPLVDYVIWSESGRHTPLLVGHADTVLFTATSRFRVLAVEQQQGQLTVFLAEESTRPGGRGRREHQVLEHLRERAAGAGVGPIDGPTPSPVVHPGLDETGLPYALSTAEPEVLR